VYNDIFTRMLLSREWTSYATKRKSLRVSEPRGKQRSTYRLSLPYRYSIPMLVASAVLHWLLSQSIFLEQVTVLRPSGQVDTEHSLNCLGWSALALSLLLIVGCLMIVALFLVGLRKYDTGIPLTRISSIAIGAACHPVRSRPNEALQLLQFGISNEVGEQHGNLGFSSGDVLHDTGNSSQDVLAFVKGSEWSRRFCLNYDGPLRYHPISIWRFHGILPEELCI
jgi:hypothetical protein